MGSLQSELAPLVDRLSDRPRIYADANVPAGLIDFMRRRLEWDVFFVLEHDDVRRDRDDVHYRRARETRRTLITLDHDYFDDCHFPLVESGGVIVMSAPNEDGLARLLRRIDRVIFRKRRSQLGPSGPALPLVGRKVHAHPGWPAPSTP